MFSLKALWDAYEEADFSSQYGSYACVNLGDGRIIVGPSSEVADAEEIEELEAQLQEGSWIDLPNRQDLDLGVRLVFRFADEFLGPADNERVQRYFSRRGAFRKWKDLLAERGLLNRWYRYEYDEGVATFKDWLVENDIPFEDDLGEYKFD